MLFESLTLHVGGPAITAHNSLDLQQELQTLHVNQNNNKKNIEQCAHGDHRQHYASKLSVNIITYL
jgi:hypothetical protein